MSGARTGERIDWRGEAPRWLLLALITASVTYGTAKYAENTSLREEQVQAMRDAARDMREVSRLQREQGEKLARAEEWIGFARWDREKEREEREQLRAAVASLARASEAQAAAIDQLRVEMRARRKERP